MDAEGFRKVLFIAYYFPPMGLSGVQRTAKFAKYLTRYGWKPTVLTIEPTAYYAFDETLLKEVEEAGVRIVRMPVRDVSRMFKKNTVVKMPPEWLRKTLQYVSDMFFIPDTKRSWKSVAVKAASMLLKNEHFDVIFATAPPQTDFLIGAELKRRFKLPLVVDYRDAWIEYPFKYFPTPFHKWWHITLEKKVLRAADKVLVTHRRVKESILVRHRFLDYHDILILPQGYDPEDISPHSQHKRTTRRKMIIVHAGTFYGGRNPRVFAQALANVLHHHPKLRGRIEVRFLGQTRKEDELYIKQLNLQEVVQFFGYLSHRNCVEQLTNADVLWFVIDNDYQTPGKLYEYFGVRKPILASVVEGYTKDLLVSSGAAVCVPLTDVTAHEHALVDLFQKFENNKLPRIPAPFAQKFDRQLLTGELAKIFEYLVDYE